MSLCKPRSIRQSTFCNGRVKLHHLFCEGARRVQEQPAQGARKHGPLLPSKGCDEIVEVDTREGFELVQTIFGRWPTCSALLQNNRSGFWSSQSQPDQNTSPAMEGCMHKRVRGFPRHSPDEHAP